MRKGELVRLTRGVNCWRLPTEDDLARWEKKWAHVPTDDGEIRLPPRILGMDAPETPLVVVKARCSPPDAFYRALNRKGGWCQLLDPATGQTIWASKVHCSLMQG